MRVLHVIPAVAACYGGPSSVAIKMCRALGSTGVNAELITTDANGHHRLPVPCGESIDYEGVPTRFFRRQWSEAFKYSRPLSRWLFGHVGEFDLVHVHAVFSHSSLAAASAARQARVPYVIRPLGSLLPWALGQRKARKEILSYLGVRKMLANATAIHCTSQTEKEHAEAHIGRNNAFVTPIGVDEPCLVGRHGNLALPFEPSRRPYVLFLGRVHPVKGLELLLESFITIVKQPELCDWRLVIAGDGKPSYVRSLKRLVHKLGGGEHVAFAGWLDESQKAQAVGSACLLAQPSYQENFGAAAFEALAHGTPVLASSKMDLASEIERSGGGWITDLEPRRLSAKLREAMCDEGRAARGIAGQKFVRQQYSWQQVAAKLAKQYGHILASSL